MGRQGHEPDVVERFLAAGVVDEPDVQGAVVGRAAEHGGAEVVDGTAFYDTISFDELWDGVAPT